MRHLKLLFVFLVLFYPLAAQAQDKDLVEAPISASPSYAKVALVIGVNDYQFATRLGMCVNDANSFAQFLQTKMGFPPEAITLMTDAPGTDRRLEPTFTKLSIALEAFIESVDEKSEVVLFYSGHGVRLNDEDYLVPQDGSPANIRQTCINYNALKNRLETKRPRRVLLIVDACRNIMAGKGDGGSGFGAGDASKEPQFAELRSCRPTEKSLEGDPRDFRAGVFTHFLLKGLDGDPEAVAPGGDLVTFDSLRSYVRGKVNQYVNAKYIGYKQNPIGYATLGAMVLAKAVKPVTPVVPVAPVVPVTPVVPDTPVAPPEDGNLQIASTKVSPIDGATMVYVPAGEFTMGSTGYDNENLVHKVYLDAYWIDKTPVTVAQYRKFCAATGRQMPQAPKWGWKEDHPIVSVTWDDANAYCKWAGKRLPTEAEWEKAARGADGRTYPWGNEFKSSRLWSSTDGEKKSTAPVGSFPAGASPYGCLDMAGNVWQWCADWYSKDYYGDSPGRNPTGPTFAQERVLRGGPWCGNITANFCASNRFRNSPGDRVISFGFRCAQSVNGKEVQ